MEYDRRPLETLVVAAREGHTAIVEMLLARGADPNQERALFWASREGHTEIVEMLLTRGADPNQERDLFLVSREGRTIAGRPSIPSLKTLQRKAG